MVHRDDVPAAAVEGWRTAGGVMVPCNPGEALSEALARAWRHLGVGLSLFAIYASEPFTEIMPGHPPPVPPAPYDPYALAGIGRAATEAELRDMAVPLNRLNG